MKSIPAERKSIAAAGIKQRGMCGTGGEAAALRVKFSVPAVRSILRRCNLHDPAQFSAVFRGEARRHNPHGFHVTGFERRSESRRAILREWQAIHNKLYVVFRAARVQDSIGLRQPSGLRIHHSKDSPSRLGRHLFVDRLRADRIDSFCPGWVHQCHRIADFDLRFHGFNPERHGEMLRHHGPDLNQLSRRRKSLEHKTYPIHTKSKVPCDVAAIVSSLEFQIELIPFAHQFALRRESRPLQVMYLDLQLPSVPLSGSVTSKEADQPQQPD